jgi:hypothetical protein
MQEQLEDLENYKNMRLKPARNVRRVQVRCCGSCRHHVIIDGFFCCRRENGWECDAGDGKQWEHVCDLWQAQKQGE